MVSCIHSDNVTSADNQQERLGMVQWIVGFTDGEGCFTVSIIRNLTTRFGKQIFPEFVVTQGSKSLPALEEIRDFFGCGSIVLNKRYDNHHEHLYRYCVRSIKDLNEKIIPVFVACPLHTSKQQDFLIFKEIVAMMVCKEHLTKHGWNMILRLASRMNRKKTRS